MAPVIQIGDSSNFSTIDSDYITIHSAVRFLKIRSVNLYTYSLNPINPYWNIHTLLNTSNLEGRPILFGREKELENLLNDLKTEKSIRIVSGFLTTIA